MCIHFAQKQTTMTLANLYSFCAFGPNTDHSKDDYCVFGAPKNHIYLTAARVLIDAQMLCEHQRTHKHTPTALSAAVAKHFSSWIPAVNI
jgi:hypothetical protein